MKDPKDYLAINRKSWNNRTDTHIASDFYDMESFNNGKTSLNAIELELLGELKGKKVLHLQCHFGQDSISLARMGAAVTGIDLSDKAILRAEELSSKEAVNTRFICCDIYDLPHHLAEEFDLVFTSYGTIGWLPDLNKWSKIISDFLKPGGQFVFVEFHPVVWMFDDDFQTINYNYFNTGPIHESEEGTYAEMNSEIQQEYVMWNHSMGEVINSLIGQNLVIQSMKEYNYSPYPCFKHTEKISEKKYRIKHLGDKIPMVYSLSAQKQR